MLFKTRGIVLNFIRFRESSVIVRIFTEEFGLKSYIVNGVRSQKTSKIALYQPLTLLDMVVYNNDKSNLNRISEVRINTPFQTIPFNIHKITITIFLNEILSKTLKEESTNPLLFDFVYESICIFDRMEKQFGNFHIQFMIKLTEHLGFSLHSAAELGDQLLGGGYKLYHHEYDEAINRLIVAEYDEYVPLTGRIRSDILEYLVKFFMLHIENFGEVQSLEVLKEL